MEEVDLMKVEGYIRDDASNEPIAGITIKIDAIK